MGSIRAREKAGRAGNQVMYTEHLSEPNQQSIVHDKRDAADDEVTPEFLVRRDGDPLGEDCQSANQRLQNGSPGPAQPTQPAIMQPEVANGSET